MEIIHLDQLPPDVIYYINSLLDFPSQTNLTSTSTYFKKYPITNLFDNLSTTEMLNLTNNIFKSLYPRTLKLRIMSKYGHKSKIKIFDAQDLININTLYIWGNCKISNNIHIDKLTNLTELSIINCDTDCGINNTNINILTNLTSLSISHYACNIESFASLTNLTKLYIPNNQKITDNEIMGLMNLIKLNIDDSNIINIGHLTKLKKLSASGECTITDNALKILTDLTNLNICDNSYITNHGIIPLVNLRTLDVSQGSNIGDLGIAPLTNLLNLNYYDNLNITHTTHIKNVRGGYYL